MQALANQPNRVCKKVRTLLDPSQSSRGADCSHGGTDFACVECVTQVQFQRLRRTDFKGCEKVLQAGLNLLERCGSESRANPLPPRMSRQRTGSRADGPPGLRLGIQTAHQERRDQTTLVAFAHVPSCHHCDYHQ